MRKGQDKKVKIARKAVGVSCLLLLLLLTFSAINPIVGLPVFAEGDKTVNEEDYGLTTQVATNSTVNIAFSPSSASGAVTPIDATNGDKAKIDVQATVTVQNSGGYSVYVGSTSSQLKNGNNAIDSVSSASTYANLPINRWGFSFRKASSVTDKAVQDSYVAMPATLRSLALDSNDSTNIASETRYYMLSFAARIGSDKPAGTYTNSVTMSVVSNPKQVVSFAEQGITTMQQMTAAICSAVSVGQETQLEDTRDHKFYWVSKLADENCWMTQNLDLDLSTATKLTSTTSDVPAAGWTPSFTTATTVTSSTINFNSQIETRSWSLGNYRITNPDTSNSCGSAKNSAADCSSQFTAYSTPTTANNDTNAHYILGNHYQWNAATAGTGESITTGTATNSICPKGWRLPTGGSSGEFAALVEKLGGTSTAVNITKAPFYGVRGGDVSQGPTILFGLAGASGLYWSSAPSSDKTNASNLTFSSSITPSDLNARQLGFSVRCIAR